jgi:hypothetical protein
MIVVNDNEVCETCGAYRSGMWCVNGHPWRAKKDYSITAKIVIDLDCINCPMQKIEEDRIEQGIKDMFSTSGMKITSIKFYGVS